VAADPAFGSVSRLGRDTMIELFRERGGDPDRPGKKDPLDCLARARYIHQCEWELPSSVPSNAYNRVTAALMKDVYYAGINDAFCVGAPRCLPIVDGTVVWHDALHFSADFAVQRRHALWRRIKQSGALAGLLRT